MRRGLRIGNGINLGWIDLVPRRGAAADTTRPSVVITSSESTPSFAAIIPLTITFSEAVSGFVVGDITAVGCTLSGFAGSGAVYTVNATPTSNTITIDIAQNVCADGAGNQNTAAVQFAITSLYYGLVFAYNLEEVSGNRADGSGNSRTLTELGPAGVGSGTGIVGNAGKAGAVSLTQNHLKLSDLTGVPIDADWEVSIWVNMAANGGFKIPIFVGDSGSANYAWLLYSVVNGWQFYVNTDAKHADSAVVTTTGTWHNIHHWYDKSNTRIGISVDGETPVLTTAVASVSCTGTVVFSLFGPEGGRSGVSANTLIDRCYMWNRVLSAGDRALDYASGTPTKQVP